MLALLALLGCVTPASTNSTRDTAADTAADTTVPQPDIPTGGCDMPAYDWAPQADVGHVVTATWEEAYSFPAAAIDALIGSQGVEALTPVPYGVDVWELRYTTQDRGALVEATAFAVFPVVDVATSFPLAGWLHGTSGFTDACAPTASGLEGVAVAILIASQGYVVAAPDYLGMNGFGAPAGFLHPYLVPEPTAVASLDAMRATRELAEQQRILATPDPARSIVWGGSEGGFAALWTDRYAAHYAPDLHVVASLAPVPPSDATGLATWGTTTLGKTTEGVATSLLAIHEWTGSATPIEEALLPELAATLSTDMHTTCAITAFNEVTSVDDVFTPSFLAAATTGDWDAAGAFGCELRRSTLHDSDLPVTETPTLVITGEDDDIVIPSVENADVATLCDQGMRITHRECAGIGHFDAALYTMPDQLAWLHDRLAGEPQDDLCVVHQPADCSLE